MSTFKAPKGTYDLIPPDSAQYLAVREAIAAPLLNSGYGYIETPGFENVELFARGVGESTDIVTKEMYAFETKGGDKLALRPEGTASVLRATLEANLHKAGNLPVKLWYSGSYYRYERPQKGRYRHFSQVGAESEWRTANTVSIKDAAKKAGVNLKFADAQQRQENQIKAIRSFIAQRVNVIAFSPVVETGWDTVLREAKAAKIPVILTDRTVNVSDESLYVTFIGSDFVEEGRRAGRWGRYHGPAGLRQPGRRQVRHDQAGLHRLPQLHRGRQERRRSQPVWRGGRAARAPRGLLLFRRAEGQGRRLDLRGAGQVADQAERLCPRHQDELCRRC